MARSIHTTRRDVEEAKRRHFDDEECREAKVKQLDEAVAKKRRVKKSSTVDRIEKPPSRATLPELVPIRIIDEGEFVHYPASVKDITHVLRLLPPGVLDGLDSIELRLGTEKQGETSTFLDTPLDKDPYVGRRGYTLIPGVYNGQCLGSYWPEKSRIWLLAYVYDSALPDREMWELYMRFYALHTLMHELVHHYDYTNRIARGRWRGDSEEHVEHYAEHNGYMWTRDIVIPYLETAYASQAQKFASWLQFHGGIAIPLASFIVEPSPLKNGNRMYTLNDTFFSMSSTIENLADEVAEAKPVAETRLQFARDLHYRDDFEPALQIIDKLLVEEPENLEILTLQAYIYEHQEKYDAAEKIANHVIENNSEIEDAWEVLAKVYEASKNAAKLLEAVSRAIALKSKDGHIPGRFIYQRARAHRWLGDHEGYAADIALLEASSFRLDQRFVKQLHEEEQEQS